jgi:hypothetical protein
MSLQPTSDEAAGPVMLLLLPLLLLRRVPSLRRRGSRPCHRRKKQMLDAPLAGVLARKKPEKLLPAKLVPVQTLEQEEPAAGRGPPNPANQREILSKEQRIKEEASVRRKTGGPAHRQTNPSKAAQHLKKLYATSSNQLSINPISSTNPTIFK